MSLPQLLIRSPTEQDTHDVMGRPTTANFPLEALFRLCGRDVDDCCRGTVVVGVLDDDLRGRG